MKTYKEITSLVESVSGEMLEKVKKWADKSDGFTGNGITDEGTKINIKRTKKGKLVTISGKDLKGISRLNPKEITFTDNFMEILL